MSGELSYGKCQWEECILYRGCTREMCEEQYSRENVLNPDLIVHNNFPCCARRGVVLKRSGWTPDSRKVTNVQNGSFHTKKCMDSMHLRPRPTISLLQCLSVLQCCCRSAYIIIVSVYIPFLLSS